MGGGLQWVGGWVDSILLTSLLFSIKVGEDRKNERVDLPFLPASRTKGKRIKIRLSKSPSRDQNFCVL